MTDLEFLHSVYRNSDAVDFVKSVVFIADVWDNLIDGDQKELRVNEMMWAALVTLPQNPFYRAHEKTLHPLMVNGILNWFVANDMQLGSVEDRNIAHVIRYSAGDVAIMCANLIGGPALVQQHGAEIRRRMQKDTLEKFQRECYEKIQTSV